MSKVQDLLKEIQVSLVKKDENGEESIRTSASAKDEEAVMRAMLNDKEYKVDVYARSGKVGEYCPYDDARSMIGSVIAATTKISQEEARELAEAHEFKKSEAQSMVNISKEYMNTYMESGRRISLGGRPTSNVSLMKVHKEESEKGYPKKVGVDENGEGIYENGTTITPAHDSVKVFGKCPDWLK